MLILEVIGCEAYEKSMQSAQHNLKIVINLKNSKINIDLNVQD